ncbi:MAG: hypothetical protein O9297_07845 [Flavobacterium sp.]|uniref:hypothetical protein n=1 Tax=Flavobacterium sp. TaxID=239 RepID=UPI0022C71FA5|nr:hypothetical protein [Flavobacterium sp.]MCZ8170012.1 hypothetical protein [Flavobacterium sp.]MCZ8297115.1 hypothetical protein [Flavobacterium sp.]
MSGILGGNFWAGFTSGAISSIASTIMMGGSTYEYGVVNGKSQLINEVTHKGLMGSNQIIGTLAAGAISGGAGAALAKGNFWQGAVTGLMVAGLNHLAHEYIQQKSQKTIEDILKKKLISMKIGDKIEGKELNFLDSNASIGIKNIEKLSNIKFKVNPTFKGNLFGISDDAYITIEANSSISGNYYDHGKKTYTGFKITTYNMPLMKVDDYKFNSFILSGDYGFFKTSKTDFKSWKITK